MSDGMRLDGTVLTVGTFDGVHRGHRLVLERLATRGRVAGLRSVLVTFAPHPLEVVNPAAAPLLLTTGVEKTEVLAETQIDYALVVPFTRALAKLDAEQFVDQVLLGRLGMRELFIGYDHGFGRGRTGDAAVLAELGRLRGFTVNVVPPAEGKDGRPISSTAIRRAIAGGDLARAADGLGRRYSVSGRVVRGAARGRLLGFRTLNIENPSSRKLLPPAGVYAIRAQTLHGTFDGMMNLGPRPTFDEPATKIEAHLFDATGEWYDTHVRVDFVARLRDTRKFDGPEALMRQLALDEELARIVIGRSRAGL